MKFLIPIIILNIQIAFAQVKDTVSIASGKFFEFEKEVFQFDEAMDSSLTDIHLGTIYADSQSNYFNRGLLASNSYRIDHIFGIHQWQDAYPYFLKAQEQEVYQVTTPITRLFYSNASLKEQWFSVFHTQNIAPNTNVSILFNRNDSKGFYLNQKLNYVGFRATFSSISKNNKWGVLGSANWNRLRQRENGGMESDSIFIKNTTQSPLFENVNLSNAQSFNKMQSFGFQMFRNIGKSDTVRTSMDTVLSYAPVLRMVYSVNVEQWKSGFVDNGFSSLNPIYQFIDTLSFLQGSVFKDSVFTAKIIERLDLLKLINKYYGFSVGARHQYVFKRNIGNAKTSNNFNAIGLSQTFNFKVGKSLTLEQGIELLQYQQGSLKRFGQQYNIGLYASSKFYTIRFTTTYNQKPIDITNLNLINTRMLLDTQMQVFSHFFQAQHMPSGLTFEASISNVKNYYLPIETGTNSSFIELYRKCKWTQFKLIYQKDWNHVGLQSALIHQFGDSSVLFLPEQFVRFNPYLKFEIRKVMKVNIGLDAFWWRSRSNLSYNPVLNQYSASNIQPISSLKTPIATVYVSAHLKRAKFFVAYQFANKGVADVEGYYQVYKYPQPLSYLKLGLSWDMLN